MKVIYDVSISRNLYKTGSNLYENSYIYAAELSLIRVQYTGHMSMSVSRDQYTALPLVGVLMASYGLSHNIINYMY